MRRAKTIEIFPLLYSLGIIIEYLFFLVYTVPIIGGTFMQCKKCGFETDDLAKFCPQCGASLSEGDRHLDDICENEVDTDCVDSDAPKKDFEDATIEHNAQNDNSTFASWYYVGPNNEQKGPFTKGEMVNYLNQSIISGNTFVWKSGLSDWIRLRDSELASYIHQREYGQMAGTPNQPNFTYQQQDLYIENRSIALDVVLTIVTCGLYGLYWLYCLAKNVNIVAMSNGKSPLPGAGMVVLLNVVTCGIYGLYFYWKAGKIISGVHQKNGYVADDDALILVLFSIFGLSILSNAILENNLNEVSL